MLNTILKLINNQISRQEVAHNSFFSHHINQGGSMIQLDPKCYLFEYLLAKTQCKRFKLCATL